MHVTILDAAYPSSVAVTEIEPATHEFILFDRHLSGSVVDNTGCSGTSLCEPGCQCRRVGGDERRERIARATVVFHSIIGQAGGDVGIIVGV